LIGLGYKIQKIACNTQAKLVKKDWTNYKQQRCTAHNTPYDTILPNCNTQGTAKFVRTLHTAKPLAFIMRKREKLKIKI